MARFHGNGDRLGGACLFCSLLGNATATILHFDGVSLLAGTALSSGGAKLWLVETLPVRWHWRSGAAMNIWDVAGIARAAQAGIFLFHELDVIVSLLMPPQISEEEGKCRCRRVDFIVPRWWRLIQNGPECPRWHGGSVSS